MNIANWLARSAHVFPNHPALVMGARPAVSYREFANSAATIARVLVGGPGRPSREPGNRIALLADNCPAYLEAMYAIWWAGCVAVPINAKLHTREAVFILVDAAVSVCFVSAEWAKRLDGVAGALPPSLQMIVLETADFEAMKVTVPLGLTPRQPDDLAWLFYTSGTTGKPKGAMLTHRNIAAMTFNYFSDVDSIDVHDCLLHAAPVSHGSGLYNFAHVLRAACQVFPGSQGFEPAEIVALLSTHAGVSMFAAPTMVKRLTSYFAQHGGDSKNLKTIIYGGGPMYLADLKQSMQLLGNKLVQIYGQGESPMTISALSKFHHVDVRHPRHEARLASVGVAHSGVEIRICNDAGTELTAGEAGEVCVKSDAVMSGYWNDADATAQSLRQGWLLTGDIGSLDEDGFLTLLDRSKDLIISGGANIYPREIEEVILQHPAVEDVSVVGRADADWGETVVAFVVVRAQASVDSAALDRYCLDHVARFKRPKEYRFVAELPKNNYGKVLKTELRKLL